MKSILKRFQGKKAGFTLIELLVVIAIIGVLASIVLASLNNARQKSRNARRVSDVKQLQLALELYFDGTGAGQYPAASITCDPAAADGNFGLKALQANGYIPQVPRDPQATGVTGCYSFATPSSGSRNTYHLGTTLEGSDSPVLSNDKDCTSSGIATCVGGVTSYTNGFAGTDPVFDVIP